MGQPKGEQVVDADTPAAGGRRVARGSRRATIRAVAAHAGVSRQTVSNALNSPERLTPATLKAVRAAIEELGYRPHEAGRSLTSRRSRVIAVSLGRTRHDPSASSYPLIVELVRSAARHGHRVVLLEGGRTVDDELDAYADVWSRGAADAVVFADTCVGDVRPSWLSERGIPFAVMGAPWGDPDADHHWIEIDGAAGMRSIVEHLASLGHERIAYLTWEPDGAGGDERKSGWWDAMASRSYATDLVAHESGDSIDGGHEAAARLLGRGPTAIVCASDRLAVGASRAVEDAGLRVGADIAVTGYDDSPLSRSHRPPLTSVLQPVDQVADFLVDTVLSLTGATDGGSPESSRRIAPKLVVRESSAQSRS